MRNKMKWLFPEMALALTAPLVVIALSMLFGAGAAIGQSTDEPQTNTDTSANLNAGFNPTVETRLVERNTVQYVDRPVTEVRYVERVEKIPAELRNFNDLEELKQWLVAVDANTTTVYFQPAEATVDCDDYALDLQHKALADGYIMSFAVIGRSEYNGLFQTQLPPGQSLHAINLTIIGNSAYYIEPQTDEIVLAAYLD